MSESLHRNVIRVIEAGRELGVDVSPRHFAQGAKTAQDAADAIGVDVGQIVKSLIFGSRCWYSEVQASRR
jgi:prolyl-tRNA editing enzyme YbaK/EbsC (Cys-tRNA(Pro) deacylase)